MRKKETRGGTRQGSGAKPKYREQTKTVILKLYSLITYRRVGKKSKK